MSNFYAANHFRKCVNEQLPWKEHQAQNKEHPAKLYQTSLDNFPKKIDKTEKPICKDLIFLKVSVIYRVMTTYSKNTKVCRDRGDNTINLVQLGCVFKDSQSPFVYVNCIYHAYKQIRCYCTR